MLQNKKMNLQQHGSKNYILSGKLFCANCGARMYGNVQNHARTSTFLHYACANSWRKHSCPARHIPAEDLENEVIEMLQTRICSPEFLQEVSQQLQNDNKKKQETTQKQRESSAKRLRTVNSKIQNLVNLLSDGILLEEVEETLVKLKQEKEMLTATLDTLDNLPASSVSSDLLFSEKLAHLTSLEPAEQAALLRQYVDKIYVFAEKKSQSAAKVEIYLRSDQFSKIKVSK